MDKQTREAVLTAMHGEAFAYAKYMLFADMARESGNDDLAELFRQTAEIERLEHFAELADLIGLVGSDGENLRDAIQSERYETEQLYRAFAEQAAAAGDRAVADRFTELARDEAEHLDAFRKAAMQAEVAWVAG